MKKLPALLVVADRARMRAYSVRQSARGPVVKELESRSGNVQSGGSERPHGCTISENELAERIADVLRGEQPCAWGLAAPKEIHGAIVDELAVKWQRRLTHHVPKDLTRLNAEDVAERFADGSKVPVADAGN